MTDKDEVKRLNDDLSRLLRASVFPGAVSSFPKTSVTHEMLSQADPLNEEFRVEKTHFSKKYDLKNFMEAEFARRNLFKQVAKESKQ
eukprot:663788-Hanusia_phi.AAC.1